MAKLIASRYAEALFELALESDKLELLDKINTATQFKIAGNATVRCKRTMDDSSAMLVIKVDK